MGPTCQSFILTPEPPPVLAPLPTPVRRHPYTAALTRLRFHSCTTAPHCCHASTPPRRPAASRTRVALHAARAVSSHQCRCRLGSTSPCAITTRAPPPLQPRQVELFSFHPCTLRMAGVQARVSKETLFDFLQSCSGKLMILSTHFTHTLVHYIKISVTWHQYIH